MSMGEGALKSTAVSREAIMHLRKTMGLDDPLHLQYWNWLARIVRANAN